MLLSVLVIAGMTLTALAKETYSITVNNETAGHTYEVYQIFTGDLYQDPDTNEDILSNVKWGSGIAGQEEDPDASDAARTLADSNGSDAEKIAAFLEKYTLDKACGTLTYNEAEKNYSISGLEPGYYLVKDKDNSLYGKDDAYTQYIVQVAKDVSMKPKSAKPTVDKQVRDEAEDAEDGAIDGWGESADHAINESFQFKLKADFPADTNFAAYKTYKVVFHDTMSDGVTFESIESVTVDGIAVSDGYICTASDGQAGGSWKITIDDIKSVAGVNLEDGAEVVVIYNAHLNESAEVNRGSGTTTNNNKVFLEYSNNPNAGGSGELGKTPEDYVWVFTYEVDNKKVDASDEKPLEGAGFKLYAADGNTEIKLVKDETISAYRPVKTGETEVEMKSGTDGAFNIVGLDAGSYILKETSVPAGYNKCDDVKFTIEAKHAEDAGGASAKTTLTSNSTVSNTIANKKGAILPKTGGIGTTIFYVLGTVLVVGAGILLAVKRRTKVK